MILITDEMFVFHPLKSKYLKTCKIKTGTFILDYKAAIAIYIRSIFTDKDLQDILLSRQAQKLPNKLIPNKHPNYETKLCTVKYIG